LLKARKKVPLQSSAAIKNKPKDDRTEDQIVGCPLKECRMFGNPRMIYCNNTRT